MHGVKGLLVLMLSLGAMTQAAHAANQNDCDGLLVGQANEFEFAVSDLEGLYLDLVHSAGDLAAQTQPNPRLVEIFLKKKAEFLNDLIAIVMGVQKSPAVDVEVLRMMALSVGVPPEALRFELRDRDLPNTKFQDPIKIGFNQSGDLLSTPEPRRSIGFGALIELPHEQPLRSGGLMQFLEIRDKGILVVVDLENNKPYAAPYTILHAMSVETDEKAMELTFDPRRGWFVAFQNLLNPDGKIGF